jgi:hypothetical protein
MRNLLIIILISMLTGICACSEDPSECIIEPSEPTIEELEAKVIENCHALEVALVEFVSFNRGACPVDIYSDTNDLGLTVIDYLPGGELMENPFTGDRTEPVDTIATETGQTGYYLKSSWYPALYYINGFGESSIVVELSNREELEQKVIENCFIVREAVMRFALLNSGVYPVDVSIDTTPEGYTVTDLLPGGVLLENPFHLFASEPVNSPAAIIGTTGHIPIFFGGSIVGYTITGVGAEEGVMIFTAGSYPHCTFISMYDERIYCSGDCCF